MVSAVTAMHVSYLSLFTFDTGFIEVLLRQKKSLSTLF